MTRHCVALASAQTLEEAIAAFYRDPSPRAAGTLDSIAKAQPGDADALAWVEWARMISHGVNGVNGKNR